MRLYVLTAVFLDVRRMQSGEATLGHVSED
jgi:hypothetical protein